MLKRLAPWFLLSAFLLSTRASDTLAIRGVTVDNRPLSWEPGQTLELGDQLGISVETVRSHVKNICQKMHVRNRVEAVAKHQATSN